MQIYLVESRDDELKFEGPLIFIVLTKSWNAIKICYIMRLNSLLSIKRKILTTNFDYYKWNISKSPFHSHSPYFSIWNSVIREFSLITRNKHVHGVSSGIFYFMAYLQETLAAVGSHFRGISAGAVLTTSNQTSENMESQEEMTPIPEDAEMDHRQQRIMGNISELKIPLIFLNVVDGTYYSSLKSFLSRFTGTFESTSSLLIPQWVW